MKIMSQIVHRGSGNPTEEERYQVTGKIKERMVHFLVKQINQKEKSDETQNENQIHTKVEVTR